MSITMLVMDFSHFQHNFAPTTHTFPKSKVSAEELQSFAVTSVSLEGLNLFYLIYFYYMICWVNLTLRE